MKATIVAEDLMSMIDDVADKRAELRRFYGVNFEVEVSREHRRIVVKFRSFDPGRSESMIPTPKEIADARDVLSGLASMVDGETKVYYRSVSDKLHSLLIDISKSSNELEAGRARAN